jgi:hypothetical protein
MASGTNSVKVYNLMPELLTYSFDDTAVVQSVVKPGEVPYLSIKSSGSGLSDREKILVKK